MSKKKDGKIEILKGYPDDVVAVEFKGRIDRAAYEKTLIPEVEARVKKEGKVKFLAVIGKDYDGVTAGAAWDDLKFGLLHLGEFPRIAIVTDKKSMRKALKLFAPLIRAEVRAFPLKEMDAAKKWITDNTPPMNHETEAQIEAERIMQEAEETILPIEQ